MKAEEHSSTSVQQKNVLLSWVSFHKYSNLLYFSASPFCLVSLIPCRDHVAISQTALDQPTHHSSEGYKTSCGFKPELISVSHTFTIETAFF